MKRSLLIVLLCATAALAQRNSGSLKGSVTDEFGGVIVGATVVATDANGAAKTVPKLKIDGAIIATDAAAPAVAINRRRECFCMCTSLG